MCPVGAECCRPPHRAAPATAAAKRDGAMVDVASLTCTRSYVARVNLACWKFQISGRLFAPAEVMVQILVTTKVVPI